MWDFFLMHLRWSVYLRRTVNSGEVHRIGLIMVAWLITRCSSSSIMAGLSCLWNSNGMGCDMVAMLLMEVVMCWGLMVLVYWCLCCNVLKFWLCLRRVLWKGCCGSCVVLISVGLRCWWVWEARGAMKVDEGRWRLVCGIFESSVSWLGWYVVW